MLQRLAADGVLLLHLTFVVFVACGGLMVLHWPRLARLHLPAAAWAIYIESSGRYCPLTALENRLREAAGEAGYSGGFIEHYIGPVLYPPGLTRSAQLWIAVTLLAVNVGIYGFQLFRYRSRISGWLRRK